MSMLHGRPSRSWLEAREVILAISRAALRPPALAGLFWADRPPQTNEDFSPSANSSYLVLSPEVARNILQESEREGDEFGEGNNGLTVAGCSGKWLGGGGEVDRRTGGRAGRRRITAGAG